VRENAEEKCQIDGQRWSGTVADISPLAWHAYVIQLYRLRDPSNAHLLPRIQDVDIIYRTNPAQHKAPWFSWRRRQLSADAAVGLPRLEMPSVADVPCCPADEHTPYTYLAPHAIVDAVWFNRPTPRKAWPSHAWVEVTHCGGSQFESVGAWFYMVRGSGLFVSTGKTIAFRHHEDAAKHFLGHGCSNYECDTSIPEFTRAALKAGYDSIQFGDHCDGRCHTCGHELLLTYAAGTEACPAKVQFRAGLNASESCRCQATASLRSDRGNCAACAVASYP
jgi:hypothetical protein